MKCPVCEAEMNKAFLHNLWLCQSCSKAFPVAILEDSEDLEDIITSALAYSMPTLPTLKDLEASIENLRASDMTFDCKDSGIHEILEGELYENCRDEHGLFSDIEELNDIERIGE